MPASSTRLSFVTWAVIAVAVAAALGVAYLLVAVVPRALAPATRAAPPAAAAPTGVRWRLRQGDLDVELVPPSTSIALDARQSLDPRLDPGPFEGDLAVRFDPRGTVRARLGAEIRHGSFVLERRGRVLAHGEAGDEPVTVMGDPAYLPGHDVDVMLRYRATADGAGLRLLWRPEEGQVDLPMPIPIAEPASPQAARGLAVVQRFQCAACHRSDDPELQTLLRPGPGPQLEAVGSRVKPGWIRRWLADPPGVRHGAAMPALLDAERDAETIEDLVHFLSSLGGPLADSDDEPALADTGRSVYHRVGCVACHGPLAGEPAGTWTALGPLDEKTTPAALATFLADPVAVRPAGAMPSMRLSDLESRAIADYLIRRDRLEHGTAAGETLVVDGARARRGREAFARRGCAACHELTDPLTPPESAAPTLAQVLDGSRSAMSRSGVWRGCMAATPAPGVPRFGLTQRQRDDVAALLAELPSWRCLDVPSLRLDATMQRLDCRACHSYHGRGGVPESIRSYFTTIEDADLGDEGRLPPELDAVGWRLRPQWMHAVLAEGAVARPFMATRMPQFGVANVGRMPELLAAAAGVMGPVAGPVVTPDDAEDGRALVGIRGFNCIQCHSIAGRASIGLPGPDLVAMVERLRYPFFSAWLHDPRLIRPGTRMPTFFYDGQSGLDVLDHDAAAQIAAIWGYLSLGEFLPLPEGLTEPADYQIEVDDGPVVLRTFMTGIGPRAIACGFPQHVHFAFDAGDCRVEQAWSGRFLNAAGAWAARGGTSTDPEQGLSWQAPDEPAWTTTGGEPIPTRFLGYRLDGRRRPVFEYQLMTGSGPVTVTERTAPASASSLTRRLSFRGPPGTTVRVVTDGEAVVQINGDGRAELEVEITW